MVCEIFLSIRSIYLAQGYLCGVLSRSAEGLSDRSAVCRVGDFCPPFEAAELCVSEHASLNTVYCNGMVGSRCGEGQVEHL